MRHTDRQEFGEVMRDAAEAIGQGGPFTEGALDLMFAALGEFDLSTIQLALVGHINSADGKWRPNASYIRAQINRRAGALWISADEAWARIPKPAGPGTLTRENDRGVQVTCRDYRAAEWPAALLNQVTTEALAVAAPLLEGGEESGARMAFRACYNRLVEQETAAGRPPKYRVSGGTHDEQQVLLEAAATQGLISLPPPVAPKQLEGGKRTPGAKPDLKSLLLTMKPMAMPKPEGVDYE